MNECVLYLFLGILWKELQIFSWQIDTLRQYLRVSNITIDVSTDYEQEKKICIVWIEIWGKDQSLERDREKIDLVTP